MLSPFHFNILIADISFQLPPDTHILACADDLHVIPMGRNRFVHAQTALVVNSEEATRH